MIYSPTCWYLVTARSSARVQYTANWRTTPRQHPPEVKIAQDAANGAALIVANAAADAALHTNPAAGGSGAGNMFQPLIPAILKAVGRQTPATQPVVIQPLPEIAQNGAIGANWVA